MKKVWKKGLAALLAAALCLPLSAGAMTVEQCKSLLEEYYLNDIPQAAQEAETVEEVIEALNDPYTLYMDKETFTAYMASMEDTAVVGIGISGLADPAGLLVVGVYAGSPAEELGLVSGDIIIKVEGHETAGNDASLIASWLRGEAGTEVTFTVRHADGSEERYTAVRAEVVIPTATAELLEDGTTGYINCTAFGSETAGQFVRGVQAYDDANLWVVDVRSNGGGDVYAVTQALGVFLGTGTMVYLRDSQDDIYRYVSQQEQLTIHPVITLVSGQTASAAEIFALAVKDRHGGMVIGSNTYGKGVAQVVLNGDVLPETFSEGDGIRITAYEYYGTNLSTAQTIGVIPDLLVDTNDADEIAALFSTGEPEDSTGWARLHLGGWRWYLDLEAASTEENAPYLTEMLEAVPPGCKVYQGTGKGWQESSAAELAEYAGLTEYIPRCFSDVEGLDCENAANTLRTYYILLGYGDGTFRPEQTMTRAELCALLVQAMNLFQAQTPTDYTDVSPDDWYYEAVQAVTAAGYMNGTGNGRFHPEGTVTEEEMITVLGRLAAALNLNFYQANQDGTEKSGVPETFSDWSEPWVWLLALSQKNVFGQTLSMLPAELEEIDPGQSALRGEVAMTLYNILNAVEVIPY